MDGFEYMNMVSRIEHYDQIARKMARERQHAEPKEQGAVRLVAAPSVVRPVRLPDRKSA